MNKIDGQISQDDSNIRFARNNCGQFFTGRSLKRCFIHNDKHVPVQSNLNSKWCNYDVRHFHNKKQKCDDGQLIAVFISRRDFLDFSHPKIAHGKVKIKVIIESVSRAAANTGIHGLLHLYITGS